VGDVAEGSPPATVGGSRACWIACTPLGLFYYWSLFTTYIHTIYYL